MRKQLSIDKNTMEYQEYRKDLNQTFKGETYFGIK